MAASCTVSRSSRVTRYSATASSSANSSSASSGETRRAASGRSRVRCTCGSMSRSRKSLITQPAARITTTPSTNTSSTCGRGRPLPAIHSAHSAGHSSNQVPTGRSRRISQAYSVTRRARRYDSGASGTGGTEASGGEAVDALMRTSLLRRARSPQRIPGDVGVTQQWQHEGELHADAVGEHALQLWDHRATEDRHHQQTRGLGCERPEALDAEGEQGREHDGVEQPNRDHAPHRQRPAAEDGGRQQCDRHQGEHAQQHARRDPAQQRRADEAPGHRGAPVVRDIVRGAAGVDVADARSGDVTDQEAADGHLRADVDEDGEDPQAHVPVPQHLGEGVRVRIGLFGGFGESRQAEQVHAARRSHRDRKSTRLNSSHVEISYAVFCLKKKKKSTKKNNKKRKQQKKRHKTTTLKHKKQSKNETENHTQHPTNKRNNTDTTQQSSASHMQ